MAAHRLVLGTHNRKKAAELLDLLTPHGFELRCLAELTQAIEVDETGNTFSENAMLKATKQAIHLGEWVLGEDSGLCVEPLHGVPGVYSARYAGPQATDEDNNAKLLRELKNFSADKRTAFYVCHATLSDPQGNVRAESEGRCYGRIRTEAAGTGGFGYDPLFEIVEYHRTFGELGNTIKSVLSHRSRAMAEIVPRIVALAAAGKWIKS
jgi:XTP/dITP diphosphohydrolase